MAHCPAVQQKQTPTSTRNHPGGLWRYACILGEPSRKGRAPEESLTFLLHHKARWLTSTPVTREVGMLPVLAKLYTHTLNGHLVASSLGEFIPLWLLGKWSGMYKQNISLHQPNSWGYSHIAPESYVWKTSWFFFNFLWYVTIETPPTVITSEPGWDLGELASVVPGPWSFICDSRINSRSPPLSGVSLCLNTGKYKKAESTGGSSWEV